MRQACGMWVSSSTTAAAILNGKLIFFYSVHSSKRTNWCSFVENRSTLVTFSLAKEMARYQAVKYCIQTDPFIINIILLLLSVLRSFLFLLTPCASSSNHYRLLAEASGKKNITLNYALHAWILWYWCTFIQEHVGVKLYLFVSVSFIHIQTTRPFFCSMCVNILFLFIYLFILFLLLILLHTA